MLNWIRKLALPPMSHLLSPGEGGGALPAAGPKADWLALLLADAQLQSLARGRARVTLFAPTDDALRQAGITRVLPPHWLMRHLTVLDNLSAPVVPMLDGSLLRKDGQGSGASQAGSWLDASGARVSQVRRGPELGSLRVVLVDRALQPASASLWQQIAAQPDLARFADALDRTGLAPLLGCSGPFTVFAPSDAGLDRAAARMGMSRRSLWSDPARLAELLRQHVVPGRWSSLDLPWGGGLRTWGHTPLQLTPLGQLRAGGSTVQALAHGSDQPCHNGVLHRLHDALLPALPHH